MPVPSVLIVACDNYLAGIYGRKFELDGWDVEIAENIEDGERRATKMRPSVLMLDADCTTDAAAEIARLRAMPTLQKTRLVILAAKGDRAHIQKARNAGADDYLILGHFVPQEAVQKMKKLLDRDTIDL